MKITLLGWALGLTAVCALGCETGGNPIGSGRQRIQGEGGAAVGPDAEAPAPDGLLRDAGPTPDARVAPPADARVTPPDASAPPTPDATQPPAPDAAQPPPPDAAQPPTPDAAPPAPDARQMSTPDALVPPLPDAAAPPPPDAAVPPVPDVFVPPPTPDAFVPPPPTPDAFVPPPPTPDAEVDAGSDAEVDAQGLDARAVDAQVVDAQVVDARIVDAQAVDAQVVDAEVVDAEIVDAEPPPPPPVRPVLTEFMALNANSIADDDGDHSDWIELYNPSADPLPMGGYLLSDDPAAPAKWRFPEVDIEPYGYLVVFASSKARVSADGTIHTNFKLDGDGESLLLSEPGGELLQRIDFPAQFTDVSFGVPQTADTTVLFEAGEALAYDDGLSGAPEPTFIDPDFDESGWALGAAGLGYDVIAPPVAPQPLADSIRDYAGVQGQGGWSYGHYNRTADADALYDATLDFRAFPAAGGAWGANNFWSGTAWDWTPGDPPWTQVSLEGGHPSGRNNGAWHWAIRRYTSPVAGTVRISGFTGKDSTAGDGSACHIFVDGREVFVRRFDVTRLRNYSVSVDLAVGSKVDFAIDPGFDGNDSSDQTTFTARIEDAAAYGAFGGVLANSLSDWHEGGLQGQNGWYAGTRTAATDFRPYPHDWTTLGASDQWDGVQFGPWPNGGAFASLGQKKVTPAGGRWPVRRWVSGVSGDLRLEWRMWKATTTGTGVTGRVYRNGVEVDSAAIGAADRQGVDRYVDLNDVLPGDVIDVAVDPTGPGGQADEAGDTTNLIAVIARSVRPARALETLVPGAPRTLYTRLHFDVADPAAYNRLVLSATYADGLYAWLSGALAVSENVGGPAMPEAVALRSRTAVEAGTPQSLVLDAALLSRGDNVLAAQVVDADPDDGRLFFAPRVLGRWVAVPRDADGRPIAAEPLPAPTPGADNLYDGLDAAPHVRVVDPYPVAEPGQGIAVTAQVVPGTAPLTGVTLVYRQMFGLEAEIPMFEAGGGLYLAEIPGGAAVRGQMVRFAVRVTDANHRTVTAPKFEDALDSEHYYGTVPTDARINTAIPVLHWFVQTPAAAGTAAGTRATIFYGDELYDNVYVNIHGQSTQGFAKKSHNFDFNADHRLKLRPDLGRVKDLNLLTNWADKAKMRNTLAWEIYRDAEADHHLAFPVHVRQNGEFFALYEIVEDGDDRMLERNGRDPEGALYKMYDALADTTRGEKKTRKDEDKSDLQALITGLQQQGDAKRLWIYDHVNLAAMANFLAAMFVTASTDCCHKNYYAYRDTNGTGEWWYIIWDLDLSFGHNWTPQFNYFDDNIYVQNRLFIGSNNALTGALFAIPEFNAMYVRRVRSLVDRIVQPPETPADLLHLESRVGIQIGLIKPDADLDYARWGSWNAPQTFDQGVARLVNEFLGPRRAWIYGTLTERAVPAGPLPPSQGDLTLRIAEIEPSPAAPHEAYVALENTGDAALDVSSYVLIGAGMDRRLEPGTVIPAHGRLYVVADARGFRARAAGPRGGQGLFVQGNWIGAIDPALQAEIELLDDVGGHVAP